MAIPASIEIVYIGECDTQSSKASSTANYKGVGMGAFFTYYGTIFDS